MPAYGNYTRDKGYDAEGAITKFTAVKGGTADEAVTQCTVAGETGVGISQFGVTTDEIDRGKGASVREDGISEWTVGAGGVSRDADVTTDADGLCIAASTGNVVWGVARQDGEAGDRVAVTLYVAKIKKPA